MTALVWFTLDLRLQDNPALAAACRDYKNAIPVYVLDDSLDWAASGASRWWLHYSLSALSDAIKNRGGQLVIKAGPTVKTISSLAETLKAEAVYFSRAYEPALAEAQIKLNETLKKDGITCKRFAGRTLFEPDAIMNKSGQPFQVFTPYYKHCVRTLTEFQLPAHNDLKFSKKKVASESLKDLQLRPQKPDWAAGFHRLWQPGEAGAHEQLEDTLSLAVERYDELRDIPATEGTSRLSPHLHYGEISPRRVWQQVAAHGSFEQAEPYLRQLCWREFGLYLLHHNPHTDHKPFKEKFADMPWQRNNKHLKAWQAGQTGYPIVDAGMRELWHTGWMHNRVRMIVASFLTKHLNIHWLEGAHWFWDTLLDADLANNSMGWQWVAGCGADAAPFFRIFNPTLQGQKFDPKGDYVRRWVPELNDVSNKHIHTPWLAEPRPEYPAPIVDHGQAREDALARYSSISG